MNYSYGPKVLSVVSALGGLGKTSVAFMIAKSLGISYNLKACILIDSKEETSVRDLFGTDIPLASTLVNPIDGSLKFESGDLKDHLAYSKELNAYAILQDPDNEVFDGKLHASLLSYLRDEFYSVIIESSDTGSEATNLVFKNEPDRFIIVTDVFAGAVSSTRKLIDDMVSRQKVKAEDIAVVINRQTSRSNLLDKEIIFEPVNSFVTVPYYPNNPEMDIHGFLNTDEILEAADYISKRY